MAKGGRAKPRIFRVVEVVDMEPILTGGPYPQSFHFRIEILENPKRRGTYHARVFRNETFRIQPTFPQRKRKPIHRPSDEHIFVEDVGDAWADFKGKTVKEVLEKVVNRIRKIFCL